MSVLQTSELILSVPSPYDSTSVPDPWSTQPIKVDVDMEPRLSGKSGDDSLSAFTTMTAEDSSPSTDPLILERSLFLRAALQLLEERDAYMESRRMGNAQGSDSSVIKMGYLRKASGRSVALTWKTKYVEVRHGCLSYEDDGGWGDRYRLCDENEGYVSLDLFRTGRSRFSSSRTTVSAARSDTEETR
jgi:hypothetical protein